MINELLATLIEVNIVTAIGVGAALLLRGPVRQRYGSSLAYAVWLIVPVLLAASTMMPERVVERVLPTVSQVEPAVKHDKGAKAQPMITHVPQQEGVAEPQPTISGNRPDFFTPASALFTWTVGFALSLALLVSRQKRFERSLEPVAPSQEDGSRAPVFRAGTSDMGPALVGFVRPRIVLPEDFWRRYAPEERALILAHEEVHLRRGDAFVSGIAAGLACLCWFNPLIHIALSRLRMDQELACDAVVLARFPHQRRLYGEVLLKEHLGGAALPLGCRWNPQHPLKERINMLTITPPTRAQKLSGGALIGLLIAGAGAIAWASQPPRETWREDDAPTLAKIEGEKVTLSKTVDAKSIKFEHAAVILRVVPEARRDYDIEITGAAPASVRSKGGAMVIEGHLPRRGVDCRDSDDAEALAGREGTMIATIRAPMSADISAQGHVFADVGPTDTPDLSFAGCGAAWIADAAGAVDLAVHGGMVAYLGDMGALDASVHGGSYLKGKTVDGPLDASIHGGAKITLKNVSGPADLSVHGGANASLGEIHGPLDASLHGAAAFSAAAVHGISDLSMHGSASAKIGEQHGSVDVSMHGSARLAFDTISANRLDADLRGGSEISADRGEVELLTLSLDSSSEADLGIHAKRARVQNKSANNVYLASVDTIDLEGKLRTD